MLGSHATVGRLMRRAAVLLLFAGCWTSAQHGDVIDSRLKALEADDQDHQEAIVSQRKQLAEQVPRIDAKLEEMNQTLDRINQATHRTGADVGVRLDELQEQLQHLRGSLDEVQHRIDQLVASDEAKFAAVLGPEAMAQVSAKEKAAKVAPADRSGLFAAAYKQVRDGDPALGRELFSEYLRRYPKDPQAGEAQYGVADSFYKEGKFKEAALAFQKVVDQYPNSSSVCDARLKLGLSLGGLKLLEDERAAFEETLRRCGGKVAVAKQARAKLEELKRGDRVTKGKKPPAP
jgi:TolA-binding protein